MADASVPTPNSAAKPTVPAMATSTQEQTPPPVANRLPVPVPSTVVSTTASQVPPQQQPLQQQQQQQQQRRGSTNGVSRPKKKKRSHGAGENTGRWTAEEHRLFLQGLEQHGKGWKKIASLIKSRTVVQIRTHAQKYFQKLAKARQNGEEGDVSMEGRGGISTLTSSSVVGSSSSKRRRQLSGTKRKAIHSIVSSVQREGKRQAAEQEQSGIPSLETPLPAVSPVLANFVLPEAEASASSTQDTIISGSALEDSLFRFLTPTPVVGKVNEVARQAGADPITLPSDEANPSAEGEISPTGVADLSLASWVDGKDPPAWFTKGADVEELLDVADTLDWLEDPGDAKDDFLPQSDSLVESEGLQESHLETEGGLSSVEIPEPAVVTGVAADPLVDTPQEPVKSVQPTLEHHHHGLNKQEAPPLSPTAEPIPSIFDGAPDEGADSLAQGKSLIPMTASTVELAAAVEHGAMQESLFDTPTEENDFMETILKPSTNDLPSLANLPHN